MWVTVGFPAVLKAERVQTDITPTLVVQDCNLRDSCWNKLANANMLTHITLNTPNISMLASTDPFLMIVYCSQTGFHLKLKLFFYGDVGLKSHIIILLFNILWTFNRRTDHFPPEDSLMMNSALHGEWAAEMEVEWGRGSVKWVVLGNDL